MKTCYNFTMDATCLDIVKEIRKFYVENVPQKDILSY